MSIKYRQKKKSDLVPKIFKIHYHIESLNACKKYYI